MKLLRNGSRNSTPTQRSGENELMRTAIAGIIIPDLDEVMQLEISRLPSPASPILPVHLRPPLLAGVAIVQHAGPEMLHMLSGHMMGENKARFDSL